MKTFTWKIVGNGCRVNQQVAAAAILSNFIRSWRNSEEVDFKNLTLLLLYVYLPQGVKIKLKNIDLNIAFTIFTTRYKDYK